MDIVLEAQSREKKEKLGPDFLPAAVYGSGSIPRSLKIKKSDLERTYRLAGESNLIDLKIEGDTKHVLIKDVQKDIVSGRLIHADFFEVNMKNKIRTEIPLHFIGESKAVKELSGSLIKELDSLEVECLPRDLVDHIDIDISGLNELQDNIKTDEIILPKGMELVNENSRVIVSVLPPKAIEEELPEEEEGGEEGESEEKEGEETENKDEK